MKTKKSKLEKLLDAYAAKEWKERYGNKGAWAARAQDLMDEGFKKIRNQIEKELYENKEK